MNNSILLDGVGHHFDTSGERIRLFQRLNLLLEAGNSYAIVGASGVGKSSLLTLAAGLEQPKEGKITPTIDGKTVNNHTLRQHSGFIFQQFHLLPELDVLGNLALPLRLKGKGLKGRGLKGQSNGEESANAIAENWLKKIGLENRARHKPAQLSGGEQQRVAIARAFVTAPAFIFADEPTGNLDQKTAAAISGLMFDFASEHQATMVVVTHSLQLANQADHCFSLSHGSLEAVT